MVRQVYMDYHLPINPNDITLKELHFFYDSLISGLIKMQKRAKEENGK